MSTDMYAGGIRALDLAGPNIGHPITYRTPGGVVRGTGGDAITMITHKKNGHVLVRFGQRNAQVTLHPMTEILSVV
jgi:hypothetical protein